MAFCLDLEVSLSKTIVFFFRAVSVTTNYSQCFIAAKSFQSKEGNMTTRSAFRVVKQTSHMVYVRGGG